jgi:Transposase
MRKSRFSESRIVAILKEGEASVALSELTWHGISRATYFNWRADLTEAIVQSPSVRQHAHGCMVGAA